MEINTDYSQSTYQYYIGGNMQNDKLPKSVAIGLYIVKHHTNHYHLVKISQKFFLTTANGLLRSA